MAQIRSADMACDQKGGLHGKELTPEGDFLVAFLRFGLLYFLLEDEQCDTLIWVDPEWHPKVQKAFEQLWHLLERTNPGRRRSEWTCYVEKKNKGRRGNEARAGNGSPSFRYENFIREEVVQTEN
uniref:Uncharacterized protein n=1 Tax=Oryza rufipogon TaxID=4529 RepID=A0A0E0NDD2_ORYRU